MVKNIDSKKKNQKMFWLFLASVLSTLDIYWTDDKCSYRSNGNFGVLKFRGVDNYDQVTVSRTIDQTYYVNEHFYTTYCAWGSFCPLKSGDYSIYSDVLKSFQTMFNGSVVTVWGDACTGHQTYEWKEYLYANRCYPYAICSYGICGNPEFKGTLNGEVISSKNAKLIDCFTNDCIPDYYTDTCSKKNDAYCNGNGEREYGRDSQGFGCTCNKFKENIFCEDPSKYYFEEGKRGVLLKSYYGQDQVSYTEKFANISYREIGESYATVSISTMLFVPQNTTLQFQLVSVPYAELYIDGVKQIGSLSDTYRCDDMKFTKIETPKKEFTRGNHLITIKMNSGCAIYTQAFQLKWKFYRWYRNNPPDYEDIPARYLGLPE